MSQAAANLVTGRRPPAPQRPVLEREAELAAIARALAGARHSRGAVVAIEGAPGMGRSRLLGEAGSLARGAGMEVLSARARWLERNFSLGVARQLLEGRVAHAPPRERRRLFAGPASHAAPLMLEGMGGPRPSASGGASSVSQSLYSLCSNIAALRPLVLTVDDADCLDEASLRFLVYLAERIRALPVAVVLAVEPGDSGPALLRELVARPPGPVLRIQPLSPGAVARHLRGSRFPEADLAFTHAVHAASGGNPFLLDRLAAELERIGVEPYVGSVELVGRLGPASIAEATERRLRRIGPGAVELARAVALLGEAEPPHAAELAELEPADAVRFADALRKAGIFRTGESLCFAQPAVRNSLNLHASNWELAERSLRAARMLDREGRPSEEVALHLLAARPGGDARTVDVLCTAADRALLEGDPTAAVSYLRRALQEPPATPMLATVLVKLGRAEAVAGDSAAVEHLSQAARLMEDPSARASIAFDIGGLRHATGRHAEAAAALQHGLIGLDEADAAPALRLRAARAVATGADLPRAELELAAGDEQHADGHPTLFHGVRLGHLAYARALRGDGAREVRGLARRALIALGLLEGGTAHEEGPLHMLDYSRAIAALILVEDLRIAERALDAAVERARVRGAVLAHADACYLRSWARLRRGRLEDADTDARTTLASMRHGWQMAVPGLHAVLAEIAVERGELSEAERHLWLGGRERPSAWQSLPLYIAAVGRVRLAHGRVEGALDAYLECGRRLIERGATAPGIAAWRQGAAAAYRELGREREAHELLHEELDGARRFGVPGAVGRALHALGSAAGGDAALDRLSDAVEALERSEATLDYARALVDLGGARRRAGKRHDSRAPLRLGLAHAERCGARALSRRARTEIAAAGGVPRSRALSGPDALTPRERQVAGLAARGMSNRQIANALFVSVKTVEWHLRNSYGKLEVSSRRELRASIAAAEPGSVEV